MKEDTVKNKKVKIRNILICFMGAMLLLTLFSNTIINLSLPQVTVTKIKSGTIYTKVRGSGKVEAVHNYEIKAEDSRKIKQIYVTGGDSISENQLLVEYENKENEELSTKEETLNSLNLEYQKALLEMGNEYGTNNLNIQNARDELLRAIEKSQQADSAEDNKAVLKDSIAKYSDKLNKLEEKVNSARQKLEENGNRLDTKDIDSTITLLERETADLQVEITDLNSDLQAAETENNAEKVATLKRSIRDKETALSYKNKDLKAARESLKELKAANKKADKLNQALEKAEDNYNKTKMELDQEREKLATLESEYLSKDEAQTVVKDKEAALKALILEVKKQSLDFDDLSKRLNKQQESIAKIKENDHGNQCLSPVSGIINEVAIGAGDRVSEGDTLIKINMIEQGYTVSFPVTMKQSEYVKVGDKGEILNLFDETAKTELTKISLNPDDPNKSKILTFRIEGESIQVSQSLAISVGSLGESYDTIIPINSIFEDNQGKFVYLLKTRATPLGNRYSAERKAVEVIAADDMYAAILSDIATNDYVITESVEPLKNGTKVRMVD